MASLPKSKPQSKQSDLDRFRKIKPEGTSEVFKFEVGQSIIGKFLGRRTATTKLGPSKIFDVDITASDSGDVGERSVFESGHLTSIFDKHALKTGDIFYLRLDSVDEKTNFKRYAFKIIERAKSDTPADDEIPF